MIRTLQIIYNRLHMGYVDSAQAMRFLAEKQKIDPSNGLYHSLLLEINGLREQYVPPNFVERFCLAKISEYILLKYPVNIAEAFLLSYVALNKPVELSMMYLKLGTSGLIGPTRIGKSIVTDAEAVAQYIIKSLCDVDFIKITDNGYIILGKDFSIDL